MRSPPHAASGTSGLVSSQLRSSARLDGISPVAGEISREISLASARSRAISGSFSHPKFSSDTRVSQQAHSHKPSKLHMGGSILTSITHRMIEYEYRDNQRIHI